MKENKGITLIALIVTIIVLIILAGVAIAMLRGDNGILNRAEEAKYLNSVGSFDEQVRLAQMAVRTEISANKVNIPGYIATISDNFKDLVDEVRNDLGVAKGSSTFNKEGFSVISYLDQAGSETANGVGYILIAYSDNSLRASLPSGDSTNTVEGVTTWRCNGVTFNVVGAGTESKLKSANQATLAYVIKVSNYNCELSGGILTDTETLAGASGNGTAGDWAVTGIYQTASKTFAKTGFTAATVTGSSTTKY